MPNITIRISFLLIFLVSLPIRAFSQESEGAILKMKCVVIDAGHGGHDPGALSPDKKVKEKTITLDVALKLGAKIKAEYPDINVIYTRSKDVYLTLAQRSDIANKNHADLFISIHVNSVKGKSSPSGTETHVMGMNKSGANMEVSKIENSVILLEEDYSTTYQGFDPNDPESFIFFNLMQNAYFEQSLNMASFIQKNLSKGPIVKNRGIKQTPLLVLWRTTMPSVLVELGFISNSSDRKTLTTPSKREEIAKRLFNAFVQFKNQYEIASGYSGVETEKETKSEDIVKSVNKVNKVYKIQIFATSKKVKEGSAEFKGEKGCEYVYVNGLYKYMVGSFDSKTEAQNALKKYKSKFPGAFVVVVDK